MLIPKDPQDEKNCILEIRAGTGGDEASLFAGNLMRMYLKFCESKGWKTMLLSESEGTVGGYKEVQIEVTGEDVYGTLKFESGVHRVQRVPDTEGSGQRTYQRCNGGGNARGRRSRCGIKRKRCKNGDGAKRWCRRAKCK